jgi:hypothetical protein
MLGGFAVEKRLIVVQGLPLGKTLPFAICPTGFQTGQPTRPVTLLGEPLVSLP